MVDAGSVVAHVFLEGYREEVRAWPGWAWGVGGWRVQALLTAATTQCSPGAQRCASRPRAPNGPDLPPTTPTPTPAHAQYNLEELWGEPGGRNITRVAPKQTVHTLSTLQA